jgi:hypothetical protein
MAFQVFTIAIINTTSFIQDRKISVSMLRLNRRNFLYASWVVLSAVALSLCLDPVKALFKKPRGKHAPLFRKNPYVAGGRSLVAVVGGEDVRNMVRESVSMIGGFRKIGVRNKTVLVKPNVVSSRKNPTTTNPEIVRAVVSLLYEEGASMVYVGDMSALSALPTSNNMKKTGIGKAASEAGARLLFFEDYGFSTVKLSKTRYIEEVAVSDWIFRADRIINLPVVKTHRSAPVLHLHEKPGRHDPSQPAPVFCGYKALGGGSCRDQSCVPAGPEHSGCDDHHG